jgi:HEAT repeat protein
MPYRKAIYRVLLISCILVISRALLFPPSAFVQDEQDRARLIRDLKADDALVRQQAAQQLGRIADDEALGPLIEALEDEEAGVRRAVIKALEEIGSSRAVGALGRMLKDSDEFVRVNALWALERIRGEEAVNLIIAALENDNPLVRINAAVSLGRIGNPRAAGPLGEIAREDPQSYVRFAARQAVVQIREKTTVKARGQAKTEPTVSDAERTTLVAEMEQVAQRIQEEYGLVLNYEEYDIMELLDIEARMGMRHPRDTIESLLGDLLTAEDIERNRHLFQHQEQTPGNGEES